MCDRLEHCTFEFERHVEELAAAHKRGEIVVSSPVFNGPLPVNELPKLKLLVRNALRARAWFSRHGPSWAQPLPLSMIERIGFSISDYLPLHFVADYALSLHARDFDFLRHPLLYDYCRGRMADPRTPEYLREDFALQKEFPGKPIAGLDEQGRWRPLPDRASKLIEAPIRSGHLIPGHYRG